MLNIRTKCIVLSCDVIWIKKTCGEYVSRKDHTKADSNILQDEDESNKWAYVKNDPVNNEVKNEDAKAEEKVRNDQDYRGEEYVKDA